ncbi:MAG: hypothetical protein JWL69_2324 [Phycisphaerales bacterium]|nr:hypothetical protein [Phycisphaerales bacterium]MDB5354099.1 hypothetical protein [Phycisphaerales bacterium]
MTPAGLLSLTILLIGAAALSERVLAQLHRGRLRRMAADWRMRYSPNDRFRLTPRITGNFPIPGAAKIKVVDLIYGIESDLYRYVFTAEYTAGIVRGKHRVQRACSFSEPRDRVHASTDPQITLAPSGLPLLEQYRRLCPQAARTPNPSPEPADSSAPAQ